MSGDEEIRHDWRNQETEPFRMTPEEIRKRADAMEKSFRRRTPVGFIVCGLVVAGAVWWLTIFPDPLQRIGAILTLVGIAYLAWRIWSMRAGAGSDLARAAASGGVESIASYRAALVRLRDFHRGAELWSRLALLIVGPAIFLVGFARAHPEILASIRIQAIVLVVVVVAAIILNLWISRRYARRIDDLDRLRREA
jgi:hypothetical protein